MRHASTAVLFCALVLASACSGGHVPRLLPSHQVRHAQSVSRLQVWSQANSSAGTSVTVSTGNNSGTLGGDLDVAIVFGHNTNRSCVTLNVPSGWTLYDSQCVDSDGDTIWTLTHVPTADAPADFTFTVSGTEYLSAVVYELTGVNLASPIGAHQNKAFVSGSTSQTTAAIATTGNDDLVIASFAQGYSAGQPSISSWATDASSGAGVNLTTAHAEITAPGTVSATATYATAPSRGVSNILFVVPAAPNQLHEYTAANATKINGITVPLSPQPSPGNTELAIVYGHDPGGVCHTLTVPSAWTEFDDDCGNNGADHLWMLTHVAAAGEASYSFTVDGTDYLSATIYDLNGVETTNPIDSFIDFPFQPDSTTQATGDATFSHNDDLAIATFATGYHVGDPVIGGTFWTSDTHADSALLLSTFHSVPSPQMDGSAASATYSTAPQSGLTNVVLINPAATPVPGVPTHVQTADYLWTSQKMNTPGSTYAPYLTWGYVHQSNMLKVHEAGIKTIWYSSPAMPVNTGLEEEYTLISGSYTSVQAKDCSGNPIISYPNQSYHGYVSDPRASQAAAYYQSMVNWYVSNDFTPYSNGTKDWDAFFLDNNSSMLYNTSGAPCNYDPAMWGQAFSGVIAQVTDGPFVTNSLGTGDSGVGTYVNNYLSASNVIGGLFEFCFNNGDWKSAEDSQLAAVALFQDQSRGTNFGPGWWCYLDGNNANGVNSGLDGASVIPYRMYAYASFLLTYDPRYSTYQVAFPTSPSDFRVFPETGFVPLNPSLTATSLGQYYNGNVYERSWNDCYYRGVRVGACMVVINPSSGVATIPSSSYTKAAVLSGDGVLDGGAMTFTGTVPTSLSPTSAAILVK